MIYLAVLGRQPEISLAELEALGFLVQKIITTKDSTLAEIEISSQNPTFSDTFFPISRLGGTQKLAIPLKTRPLDVLMSAPEGKLTFGISDYSDHASAKSVTGEALKLKRILTRHGRSVRIIDNKTAILSNATSLHNGLSGKNPRKMELIKLNGHWYQVVGIQDIDAYTRRDQARPARDAKVGMLPPKLAQILLNLCSYLPENSRILDPFCGTGVLLQEALLMGYQAYGTDLNPRMIEYSQRNLDWLLKSQKGLFLGYSGAYERGLGREPRNDGSERPDPKNSASEATGLNPENKLLETQISERPDPKHIQFELSIADATNFTWTPPIHAVACETYLGAPMSKIPPEIKLKEQKQECKTIILGFLQNLSSQITPNTPVTIAIPAWLRPDGTYSRLEILDEIENMGYNVSNKSREGLFYHRNNQIVARDIIILRKK